MLPFSSRQLTGKRKAPEELEDLGEGTDDNSVRDSPNSDNNALGGIAAGAAYATSGA
jgi:hypothetical protein